MHEDTDDDEDSVPMEIDTANVVEEEVTEEVLIRENSVNLNDLVRNNEAIQSDESEEQLLAYLQEQRLGLAPVAHMVNPRPPTPPVPDGIVDMNSIRPPFLQQWRDSPADIAYDGENREVVHEDVGTLLSAQRRINLFEKPGMMDTSGTTYDSFDEIIGDTEFCEECEGHSRCRYYQFRQRVEEKAQEIMADGASKHDIYISMQIAYNRQDFGDEIYDYIYCPEMEDVEIEVPYCIKMKMKAYMEEVLGL